jgi:hypothetical protein
VALIHNGGVCDRPLLGYERRRQAEQFPIIWSENQYFCSSEMQSKM